MQTAKHIYTVSELNAAAKLSLEQGFGLIWLEAEISNFSKPASGHWYFSLKDNKAQIRCAFFKGRNRLVNFSPKDGQRLLVRGRISLYEPRGDYQLIVDHMEPAGEGELQKAYEELKQRLHEDGLFDEHHKQDLPGVPKHIGLITSPTGAAIRDVLHVLKRRFPITPVTLYPTAVQGEGASNQIINAIELATRRKECDVLLLVRGGGSLEDLWPFNNEQLARTIFECPVPIVSGIGHEIDYTIADFVADTRAPTPSAAAEIVVPDQSELKSSLQQSQNRLIKQMLDLLRSHSQQIDWYAKHIQQFHPGKRLAMQRNQLAMLSKTLRQTMLLKLDNDNRTLAQFDQRIHTQSPRNLVIQYKDKLATLSRQLNDKINHILQLSRYRLENSTRSLNTISPLATLARGYSISSRIDSTTPIIQASDLAAGDQMKTRLSEGHVISIVESVDE